MPLIEKWISRISVVLASVVLIGMMLQIVMDVTLRTFFGAGFPATADLVSRYYMVAISFLPLAPTEIRRRHIEATIFTDNLTGLPLKIVAGIGFTLALAAFATMTWGTAANAVRQTARGAFVDVGTSAFLTWPSYWILPVSFGLMSLMLALRIIEIATGQFSPRAHDPLDELHRKSEEAN